MQSHTTNGFFLSALLHGTVVAILLLLAYAFNQEQTPPPKIFELVAGEGDNYMATEAPALGAPGGVKIAIPEPPAPQPEPAPIAAMQPEPAQAAPVQAAPKPVIERAPVAAKAPPDAIRNFAKDVKRIAAKREKRIVDKFRKEREAEERKAKEAELKKRKMTKEEFDAQNRAEAAAVKNGGRVPKIARIDAEGIAKGVVNGSTANKIGGAGGKALTRDEGDAIDLYFSLLKRRLHEALDKPPGLSDTLVAVAEFYIGADGTLSNVRIKHSSGSEEFDRAVLEAFAHVHSIGPRPDGKSETLSISFRMHEEDEG